MSLIDILPYAQVILAVILVILILIQKSEGGMGSAFGSGDVVESNIPKRRGGELVIFVLTIVIAVLFVASVFTSFLL